MYRQPPKFGLVSTTLPLFPLLSLPPPALPPQALRNFLTAVASHYHAIPYHNFNHVCHVLHATFLVGRRLRGGGRGGGVTFINS